MENFIVYNYCVENGEIVYISDIFDTYQDALDKFNSIFNEKVTAAQNGRCRVENIECAHSIYFKDTPKKYFQYYIKDSRFLTSIHFVYLVPYSEFKEVQKFRKCSERILNTDNVSIEDMFKLFSY